MNQEPSSMQWKNDSPLFFIIQGEDDIHAHSRKVWRQVSPVNNQIIHLHNIIDTTMVVIVTEGIFKDQSHPLDKN